MLFERPDERNQSSRSMNHQMPEPSNDDEGNQQQIDEPSDEKELDDEGLFGILKNWLEWISIPFVL